MERMTLHITGDAAADELLTDDPLALLIGMLLDQQIPMEVAFDGPRKIVERLGTIDPATIAAAVRILVEEDRADHVDLNVFAGTRADLDAWLGPVEPVPPPPQPRPRRPTALPPAHGSPGPAGPGASAAGAGSIGWSIRR